MKYTVACTITLLAAGLAANAQNAHSVKTVVLHSTTVPSTCPVNMRARHAFFTQRALVDEPRTPGKDSKKTERDLGMHLRLTLTNPDDRHIASAWVTVVGLDGGGQMSPVDPLELPGKSRTLKKALQVKFEPGDDGTVDAYFVAPGFSSVRTIALNAVAYADGSTWRMPDQNACSVAPEALMLVADR